ncbi:hypothetical protein [Novosphingobium sp. MBES04]|uniref:hypothetical protein n=1 Tax=Novosphingobium sp. MBES04 TaxID=1206458 RepID=UPI001A7E6C1B|nr:hypothetical protein [Novosphingobium sp. MBES04]
MIAIGKGGDTAQFVFQQPGVRVLQAVGRPELDEEALALLAQFIADPQALHDLRFRALAPRHAETIKPYYTIRYMRTSKP